jgi:hypothetical protein
MVGVAFTITVLGTVINPRITHMVAGDKKLKEAVLKEISAWVFPKQHNGSPITINRDFWF